MPFAELLARSAFSFLQGASLPEEMVEAAERLGIDSLGLCDRDGLYGVVRAHSAAKQLGRRLVVGCELSLSDVSRPVSRLTDPLLRESDVRRKRMQKERRPGACFFARNATGYSELCHLITLAHDGLPKGIARLEPEMLAQHAEGMVCIVPVPEP